MLGKTSSSLLSGLQLTAWSDQPNLGNRFDIKLHEEVQPFFVLELMQVKSRCETRDEIGL
ncbi:secreted protein [Rhodopirellula sp. SWK7]|nr:secreted protein [Rhodopirellula sp. SWK7]